MSAALSCGLTQRLRRSSRSLERRNLARCFRCGRSAWLAKPNSSSCMEAVSALKALPRRRASSSQSAAGSGTALGLYSSQRAPGSVSSAILARSCGVLSSRSTLALSSTRVSTSWVNSPSASFQKIRLWPSVKRRARAGRKAGGGEEGKSRPVMSSRRSMIVVRGACSAPSTHRKTAWHLGMRDARQHWQPGG